MTFYYLTVNIIFHHSSVGLTFENFGIWGHTTDVTIYIKFQIVCTPEGDTELRIPQIQCFPLTLIIAVTTMLH